MREMYGLVYRLKLNKQIELASLDLDLDNVTIPANHIHFDTSVALQDQNSRLRKLGYQWIVETQESEELPLLLRIVKLT